MLGTRLMMGGGGPFEATGGAEGTYTQDSKNYKKHTFTGTSTFEVKGSAGVCDVLLIAGAGSGGSTFTGGYNSTAGGGAGGMLETTGITIAPGTYTVTVGAGGPCVSDGNDTKLGTLLTATKGGAGAYHDYGNGYEGRDGGSGGGGANARGGGSGVAGQGYAGWGSSHGDGTWSGGGGGAGGAAPASQTGGPRRSNDWSGSSVDYARGGDGGPQGSGQAGGANTGDAGYGKSQSGQPPFYIGGAGGSGIAIIRYEVE